MPEMTPPAARKVPVLNAPDRLPARTSAALDGGNELTAMGDYRYGGSVLQRQPTSVVGKIDVTQQGEKVSTETGGLRKDDSSRLIKGYSRPLKKRGLLVGDGTSEIGTSFEFHRTDQRIDMGEAAHYNTGESGEGGRAQGAISTFNGQQVTSTEDGTGTAGSYWPKNKLSKDVQLINVVNGQSGTVGIKIPFSNLHPDNPVVITSGGLSGCTMCYAVDDHSFYAYHTGQATGDADWKTGQAGVMTTYQSHLALKGTAVDGVNSNNNSLPSIFSAYNNSVVTYLGKEGTVIDPNQAYGNVNLFDYNKNPSTNAYPTPRIGYSYALLSKDKAGAVKVKVVSEDVKIPQSGKIRIKQSKTYRLASIAAAEQSSGTAKTEVQLVGHGDGAEGGSKTLGEVSPEDLANDAAKFKQGAATSSGTTSEINKVALVGRDTAQRMEVGSAQALQPGLGCEMPTQPERLPTAEPNNTGLPDQLKSGIESLSGLSMDNVKVHYNSSQPAQLQAHAYAQGSEIHLAPGQEKHLPHEAWHVVQQGQGRVPATMQIAGVGINDDGELEREADAMGERASHLSEEAVRSNPLTPLASPPNHVPAIQRVRFGPPIIPIQLGADKDVQALKMDTLIAISAAIKDPSSPFLGLVNTPRYGLNCVSANVDEVKFIADPAVGYLMKKVMENPSLAPTWDSRVAHARLIDEQVRKVNRISGILARKYPGATAIAPVVAALNEYVVFGNMPSQDSLLKSLISNAPHKLQTLEFNRFLLTAIRAIYPYENVTNIEAGLFSQWKEIETEERLKVIAHRGDGATFDKMGGVLPRSEHNVLYQHENENSFASTKKFLDSWVKLDTKLSGIECDVFLSLDDVPFVTHTWDVGGLLTQERGEIGPVNDIRNMSADAIHPRFMRLSNWLELIGMRVNEKVMSENAYKEQGGAIQDKKLRIEIEMKQRDLNDATRPERWKTTNKVVSSFLKSTAHSHRIEIAMFNNSAVPVIAHRAAKTKTTLSHVTFGQGGTPEGAAELREIRFGMHQKGIGNLIKAGLLDGKVVTFAPGLDHPGGMRQLNSVHGLPTHVDVTIEQSIQKARLRLLMDLIEARWKTGSGPVSIHILTDHGETGARFISEQNGLGVGLGPKPDVHWNSDSIRAKHPKLSDQQIRDALNESVKDNYENLSNVGELLLDRFPDLL